MSDSNLLNNQKATDLTQELKVIMMETAFPSPSSATNSTPATTNSTDNPVLGAPSSSNEGVNVSVGFGNPVESPPVPESKPVVAVDPLIIQEPQVLSIDNQAHSSADNSVIVAALLSVQKYLNSCSEAVHNALAKINVGNVEVKPLQLSHASRRVVETLKENKGFVKVSSLQKASGLQASSVRSVIGELRRAGYVIESAAILHKQNPEIKDTQGYRLTFSPNVSLLPPQTAQPRILLTFGEAAASLGITTEKLRNLVKTKLLPVIKVDRNTRRIDVSDLKTYVKKHKKV